METVQGPVNYNGFQQNSDRFADVIQDGFAKSSVKEEVCENADESAENVRNPANSIYKISNSSKKAIINILEEIKSLGPLERFLIYIKLNEQISNAGDPLKQPLNPLGSRSEVCRTISWIKTHLEEDPEISLPKQQVYDEYSLYCSKIRMKPLSQADFGKVMKQVYPKVKARRLGTRGHSKYCYSGLRNCTRLAIPALPTLDESSTETIQNCLQEEKSHLTQISLASAAWLIVKQWSENQLNACFASLQALAFFLVVHCSVGLGTEVASQITSMCSSENSDGEISKTDQSHRDVQIQLQKKILQKEEASKDRKRKSQSTPKNLSRKKGRASSTNTNETVGEVSPSESSASSNNTSPVEGKTICDKYQDYNSKPATLPDFNCFQKSVSTDENDGEDNPLVKVAGVPDTPPSLKCAGTKYKTVQPKPLYQLCDTTMYNPQAQFALAENRSQNPEPVNSDKKTITIMKEQQEEEEFQTELPLSRERLNSIGNVDKDAMDDYLGKNNSEQHDEELSKYFDKDERVEEPDDTTKISQLRQLLQEKGLDKTKRINDVHVPYHHVNDAGVSVIPGGGLINADAVIGCLRRRVSFDVAPQDDTVPPSPNTRRKNFSFTPISPGPQSPNTNGMQSKCSSASVSPFVSPRNTPVPRGRHFQNQVMTLQIPPNRKPPSLKVKKELDLSPDVIVPEKETVRPKKNMTAMSAPASPMLPTKSMLQALLNSSSKVSYSPNYIHRPPNALEQAELPQTLATATAGLVCADSNVLNGFRSHSVPLHPMDKSVFLLTDNDFLSTLSQDDFNELDSIDESEKIGVTSIIDSLNEPVYNNNNAEMISEAFVDQKVLMSRSVPNTPLPFLQVATQPQNVHNVANLSHSYPSTPLLADDTFNYNVRDCLINGQPIKNDELAAHVYDETFASFDSIEPDTLGFLDKSSMVSDQNFNIRIN